MAQVPPERITRLLDDLHRYTEGQAMDHRVRARGSNGIFEVPGNLERFDDYFRPKIMVYFSSLPAPDVGGGESELGPFLRFLERYTGGEEGIVPYRNFLETYRDTTRGVLIGIVLGRLVEDHDARLGTRYVEDLVRDSQSGDYSPELRELVDAVVESFDNSHLLGFRFTLGDYGSIMRFLNSGTDLEMKFPAEKVLSYYRGDLVFRSSRLPSSPVGGRRILAFDLTTLVHYRQGTRLDLQPGSLRYAVPYRESVVDTLQRAIERGFYILPYVDPSVQEEVLRTTLSWLLGELQSQRPYIQDMSVKRVTATLGAGWLRDQFQSTSDSVVISKYPTRNPTNGVPVQVERSLSTAAGCLWFFPHEVFRRRSVKLSTLLVPGSVNIFILLLPDIGGVSDVRGVVPGFSYLVDDLLRDSQVQAYPLSEISYRYTLNGPGTNLLGTTYYNRSNNITEITGVVARIRERLRGASQHSVVLLWCDVNLEVYSTPANYDDVRSFHPLGSTTELRALLDRDPIRVEP